MHALFYAVRILPYVLLCWPAQGEERTLCWTGRQKRTNPPHCAYCAAVLYHIKTTGVGVGGGGRQHHFRQLYFSEEKVRVFPIFAIYNAVHLATGYVKHTFMLGQELGKQLRSWLMPPVFHAPPPPPPVSLILFLLRPKKTTKRRQKLLEKHQTRGKEEW